MYGRTIGSMSIREIEEGGQRFYARKGMINGEDRDGDEDDDLLDERDEPVEVITEGDVEVWEVEAEDDFLPREDEDHLYDPDFPFGH